MPLMNLLIFAKSMILRGNILHPILLNKMDWLREKIELSLRRKNVYCNPKNCIKCIGLKQ